LTQNTCQNGGTCSGGLGTAPITCTCPSGFTDANCTTLISRCLDPTLNPCKNGATCTGGLGTNPMGCICAPGWTGANCSTPITACDPSVQPCKNGGKCYLSNGLTGTAMCNCTGTGYQGANCTTPLVDYCAGVNCNYGVCQIDTALSTYKCVCNTGYSGATCLTPNRVCTAPGVFEDPIDCKNKVSCQYDANGKLFANITACPTRSTSTATYQYYYIPAPTNNCVLPSTFTGSTYFTTKTCAYP